MPDTQPESKRGKIGDALSSRLRVGARPLTADQWCRLPTDGGFEIVAVDTAPMHLLKPRRVIQDEELPGAVRTSGTC